MFRTHTRIEGDVTILELEGNITLGDASGALRDAVRSNVQSGAKSILLDLADVHYIDSAGLGELVGCYATAEKNGVRLKLLRLNNKVLGLLQVTKLITVFDVYEDEAAALRSFAEARAASL